MAKFGQMQRREAAVPMASPRPVARGEAQAPKMNPGVLAALAQMMQLPVPQPQGQGQGEYSYPQQLADQGVQASMGSGSPLMALLAPMAAQAIHNRQRGM